MARDDVNVHIEGLAEFRRDLRSIDRALPREVNQVIKSAVGRVAAEASRTAPRQSGTLAGSYRPFTRGNIAGVTSRLPYAPVIEYGGTIRPRGAEITFPRREVVTKAAAREADRVVDEIGDGVDGLARRHGWR